MLPTGRSALEAAAAGADHGPMEHDARPLAPLPVTSMRLPPPVWLDEHATLQDVARMMESAAVSAVIVGRDAAIVTERDVVCALARENAPDTPAVEIATHDAERFPEGGAVVGALAEMLHAGVRHLVIVDADGTPCAVLSLSAAAAFVLNASPVPTWVSALRIVLRVDEA
jgi:signal-transduction protein with cAMP-binding, CBS, and nucleotidyltransferase domain